MLNLTAMRFSAPPHGRPGAPSCSLQGVLFGDEAEKGRRMTTTFDLGCQRMLYSFPRDGRSSASFLPAPDLTDRGLAAFHKCRCSGCAQAGISFGTLLAFDWSWTRHVVCGSAGLGTAGMAVRGAVLPHCIVLTLVCLRSYSCPHSGSGLLRDARISCQRARYLRAKFMYIVFLTGWWMEIA